MTISRRAFWIALAVVVGFVVLVSVASWTLWATGDSDTRLEIGPVTTER